MSGEIFKGLLHNSSLLLVISILYSTFTLRLKEKDKRICFFSGVITGIVGMGIMTYPIPLTDGIFFDTRSILISSTGLFLGFGPTLVAAVMTSAYRLYLGGAGATTGILVIFTSAVIGLVWRRYRFCRIVESDSRIAAADFYIMGIVVHLAMLLEMLTLGSISFFVIKSILLPVLTIYPLGSLLIGIILKHQLDHKRAVDMIEYSEKKYRSLVNGMKQGLVLSEIDIDDAGDIEGFRFVDANDNFIDMVGRSKESMAGIDGTVHMNEDEKKFFINLAQEIIDKESVSTDYYYERYGRYFDINGYKVSNKRFAMVINDTTEKVKKQKEIEYLSFHDQLTEVYNRRFFEEELKRLDTVRNLPLAIIMADVNGLKLVNDAFGHLAGDRLLKAAAGIMKGVCRKDEIISRVGGDEFVILLPGTEMKDAESLVSRIVKITGESRQEDFDISISFGVAVKRDKNMEIEDVYKEAEDNMYKNKLFQSKKLKGNMIDTILKALYEKSRKEKEHSDRVSRLCEAMGEALGMESEKTVELKTAGLLHDIGKVGLDSSLLKRKKNLGVSEREKLRRHPDIGYNILSSVNSLSRTAEYVLAHHERWDGRGFPRGLKGEKIPYVSRIIALADAYDKMTTGSRHRLPMSVEEAKKEIRECSGTQFDPNLAKVFIDKVLKGMKENTKVS